MRVLPGIGELTQHPRFPECWASQPVPVPYFSGTRVPFTIEVDAVAEEYPADVSAAIGSFLALDIGDRSSAMERVFKNYRKTADVVDLDLTIDHPSQVWDHVRVTNIYVNRRDRWDEDIYIRAACECDWEDEHGLQLVFRQGSRLVRVSAQDGHLTHADAYDLPADRDDEP